MEFLGRRIVLGLIAVWMLFAWVGQVHACPIDSVVWPTNRYQQIFWDWLGDRNGVKFSDEIDAGRKLGSISWGAIKGIVIIRSPPNIDRKQLIWSSESIRQAQYQDTRIGAAMASNKAHVAFQVFSGISLGIAEPFRHTIWENRDGYSTRQIDGGCLPRVFQGRSNMKSLNIPIDFIVECNEGNESLYGDEWPQLLYPGSSLRLDGFVSSVSGLLGSSSHVLGGLDLSPNIRCLDLSTFREPGGLQPKAYSGKGQYSREHHQPKRVLGQGIFSRLGRGNILVFLAIFGTGLLYLLLMGGKDSRGVDDQRASNAEVKYGEKGGADESAHIVM